MTIVAARFSIFSFAFFLISSTLIAQDAPQTALIDSTYTTGESLVIRHIPDQDNDGNEDYVIGDPAGNLGAGNLTFVSSADDSVLHTFSFPDSRRRIDLRSKFGSAIALINIPITIDDETTNRDVLLVGAPDHTVRIPGVDPHPILQSATARRNRSQQADLPHLDEQVGKVFLVDLENKNIVGELSGEAAQDRFGFAITVLGDVNLDSVADFAVGAPASVLPASNPGGSASSGKIYVFSGADRSLLYQIEAHGPGSGGRVMEACNSWTNDQFGFALARLRDLDGDASDELVVGTSGSCYVKILSGATGQIIATLLPPTAGYSPAFGSILTTIEDLTEDTFSEVMVADPGFGDGQEERCVSCGRVQIYSGDAILAAEDENEGILAQTIRNQTGANDKDLYGSVVQTFAFQGEPHYAIGYVGGAKFYDAKIGSQVGTTGGEWPLGALEMLPFQILGQPETSTSFRFFIAGRTPDKRSGVLSPQDGGWKNERRGPPGTKSRWKTASPSTPRESSRIEKFHVGVDLSSGAGT